MPLDIPAIAGGAMDVAWSAAASVMVPVTVHQGPVTSYDPATDVTTTTWTTETEVTGLPYLPELKELEAGALDAFVAGRMKMLLLRRADLPADVGTDDTVTLETFVWQVKGTFLDPSGKCCILTLLR